MAAVEVPGAEVMAGWLAGQRWFATKTRRIARLEVEDAVPLGPGALVIARVALDDGQVDRYCLTIAGDGGAGVRDALDDPDTCRALLALALGTARGEGRAGALVGVGTEGDAVTSVPAGAAVRRIGGEQSNSSVAFGDAIILKLFRRLAEGVNPEAEMTRALTERARFASVPRLHGHLEYRPLAGPTAVIAVAQALVPGARDGWQWVLDGLAALYARARGAPSPGDVQGGAADLLFGLRRLGEVTGGLHVALASPEPITRADLAVWAAAAGARVAEAQGVLGAGAVSVPAGLLAAGLEDLLGRLKIRHHGDLHLGQTLYRPDTADFVVIDFEGEPLRPLAERRLKHAAVRDVAGLLRSVDYAAAASLAAAGARQRELAPWADTWREAAAAAVVQGYRAATPAAAFLPEGEDGFARAVAVFEVEKAAYEVVYEANNRPAWIGIPRRGLLTAAERLGRTPGPGAGAA
jgi:predicted trehalose synthase